MSKVGSAFGKPCIGSPKRDGAMCGEFAALPTSGAFVWATGGCASARLNPGCGCSVSGIAGKPIVAETRAVSLGRTERASLEGTGKSI